MSMLVKLLTLLVVPLPLHLLDDVQVEHGVPLAQAGAQGREEVPDHSLVLSLTRARQAREVLQDQLFSVLGKALTM